MVVKYEKHTIRQFGLVLACVLSLIGLFRLRVGDLAVSGGFFYASAIVALSAGVLPRLLYPVYYLLSHIARVIGWVNSRILLSIIFYGIFTPMSILFKICRKDLLSRKIDKTAKSYWIKRETSTFDKESFEKQF